LPLIRFPSRARGLGDRGFFMRGRQLTDFSDVFCCYWTIHSRKTAELLAAIPLFPFRKIEEFYGLPVFSQFSRCK